MISHLIVSLIVALIAIAFDSTYVDQDDLPVVTSGTSRDSGSRLCAESSWDRVALTVKECSQSSLNKISRTHSPGRINPQPQPTDQVHGPVTALRTDNALPSED